MKQTTIVDILSRIAIKLDKFTLARLLDFKTYYNIQKILGFPIQRLKFKLINGYYPDLNTPSSFNEKCIYLKLYSRNPILPSISDKYEVREYVSKKIGEEYLTPLIDVVERPEDIKFNELPDQFVIKTNYASGQNIIVENNQIADQGKILNNLKEWMKKKYRVQELIWFPQEIPRKILIETFLTDSNGNIPIDYKFFVYKGKVKYIYLIGDRFVENRRSFYDRDWNYIPVSRGGCKPFVDAEKPDNLSEMIRIAETLSEPFDFMRVDLYSLGYKIYFGELTPYPADGRARLNPQDFDYEMGSHWIMDKTYIK